MVPSGADGLVRKPPINPGVPLCWTTLTAGASAGQRAKPQGSPTFVPPKPV